MVAYVASLFAAAYLIPRHLVAAPLAWLLALVPGLAVVGAFYAVAMLLVEQKDEYVRMLTVRQILVATAIALSASTVWGFLEAFGLVAHLDSYWMAILWFAGLGMGGIVNRITHGAAGEAC